MSTNDIETARQMGELTAEVRNLTSQCSALFRRFDEHVREDREMHGVLKQMVENMTSMKAEQLKAQVEHKELANKVADHEKIKQRAIGYSLAGATGISGAIAWLAKFFQGAQ